MKRLYCTTCNKDISAYYTNGEMIEVLEEQRGEIEPQYGMTAMINEMLAEYRAYKPEELDYKILQPGQSFKLTCPLCGVEFMSSEGIKE